jgi:hypothetical protein
MLQSTQLQIDLYLRYPARKVIGAVDTPSALQRVLAALDQAGFDGQEVTVFSGEAGVRSVGSDDSHDGLAGRLTRVMEPIGNQLEHLDRYERALRDGHFLVVVATPDGSTKDRVLNAFRAGHGCFVDYYGPLEIEQLET